MLLLAHAWVMPQLEAQPPASRIDIIPIHDVVRELGLQVAHLDTNALLLVNDHHKIKLFGSSRRIDINGLVYHMNGPLYSRSNSWGLSNTDVQSVLTPLVREERIAHTHPIVVVLDPGHGGTDPGAGDRTGLTEKMLSLDVAQRVRRRFRHSGIEIKLTRNTDVFVSLAERSRRAATWNADIFASIHMNSAVNTGASGIETFILPAEGYPSTSGGTSGRKRCHGNRFDSENSRLAYYIHHGLHQFTQTPDRGVKRARFAVLSRAPCPAVLIECGFLSSAAESTKLLGVDHRESLAEGISQGLLTYISKRFESPKPPPAPVNVAQDASPIPAP